MQAPETGRHPSAGDEPGLGHRRHLTGDRWHPVGVLAASRRPARPGSGRRRPRVGRRDRAAARGPGVHERQARPVLRGPRPAGGGGHRGRDRLGHLGVLSPRRAPLRGDGAAVLRRHRAEGRGPLRGGRLHPDQVASRGGSTGPTGKLALPRLTCFARARCARIPPPGYPGLFMCRQDQVRLGLLAYVWQLITDALPAAYSIAPGKPS